MRRNTKLEISTRDSGTTLYEEKGSKHQDQLSQSALNLSGAQNADSLHRLSFSALKQATHVSSAVLQEARGTRSSEETQVNGV